MAIRRTVQKPPLEVFHHCGAFLSLRVQDREQVLHPKRNPPRQLAKTLTLRPALLLARSQPPR